MTAAPLDPRRHAFRPDLADARLEGRVDAARFVAAEAATVLLPSPPLHAGPSLETERAATLLRGEPVWVYETADSGWAWVQSLWDGYVGYTPVQSLGAPEMVQTHSIAALFGMIAREPDLKKPTIGALPFGARIAIDEAVAPVNGYLKLAGGEGWLHERHLRVIERRAPDAPAAKTGDWVAAAELFLGAPYLWGGKTAMGIDCSGLIQAALQSAEQDCPRDSDMQAAELGAPVPEGAALMRGDLVFWKGHVGVMLDADTLLHASAGTMTCAREPLADAVARIAASGGGEPTGIRRLP